MQSGQSFHSSEVCLSPLPLSVLLLTFSELVHTAAIVRSEHADNRLQQAHLESLHALQIRNINNRRSVTFGTSITPNAPMSAMQHRASFLPTSVI